MNVWLPWVLGGCLSGLGALWLILRRVATAPRRRLARISPRRDSHRTRPRSLGSAINERPGRAAGAGCALATLVAALAGGPVAGAIVLAYGVVAAIGWRDRVAGRAVERRRAETLDAIGALAADLRAGLPPAELSESTALSGPSPVVTPSGTRPVEAAPSGTRPSGARGVRASGARPSGAGASGARPSGAGASGAWPSAAWGSGAEPGDGRADPVVDTARARVAAAFGMSASLGAPLADLLDRVDADLRAGHRLRASVAAQTAGARATAVLLAGLPIAGIALGTSMGADPLGRLLHTPLGALCAFAAVTLQCAGLAWATRLTRAAVEAVG